MHLKSPLVGMTVGGTVAGGTFAGSSYAGGTTVGHTGSSSTNTVSSPVSKHYVSSEMKPICLILSSFLPYAAIN